MFRYDEIPCSEGPNQSYDTSPSGFLRDEMQRLKTHDGTARILFYHHNINFCTFGHILSASSVHPYNDCQPSIINPEASDHMISSSHLCHLIQHVEEAKLELLMGHHHPFLG